MKYINLKSVTLILLATYGSITHAAQCQAPNGKFYPYESPQCDPKITKCSGSIDHLIRKKTIDSSWMQELQKICRGAKIDTSGKIVVLDGDKFHTFNIGTTNLIQSQNPITINKNETRIDSDKNNGTQTSKLSPEQRNFCKKFGSYSETIVDSYISGISRKEAIEMIDKGGLKTELLRNISVKTINSTYDQLQKIGAVRTQAIRENLKQIFGQEGEIRCLEATTDGLS